MLEKIGMSDSTEDSLDALDPRAFGRLVREALLSVGDVLGSGFLVLLAVTFMLLETSKLKEKAKFTFDLDEAGEARLAMLLASMNRYMALKSAMSLVTAGIVYVWLVALGIDFAIFLALVAFLANFIPFLGVLIMTIPGVVLALLQNRSTDGWACRHRIHRGEYAYRNHHGAADHGSQSRGLDPHGVSRSDVLGLAAGYCRCFPLRTFDDGNDCSARGKHPDTIDSRTV